jgi:hypothetical protein
MPRTPSLRCGPPLGPPLGPHRHTTPRTARWSSSYRTTHRTAPNRPPNRPTHARTRTRRAPASGALESKSKPKPKPPQGRKTRHACGSRARGDRPMATHMQPSAASLRPRRPSGIDCSGCIDGGVFFGIAMGAGVCACAPGGAVWEGTRVCVGWASRWQGLSFRSARRMVYEGCVPGGWVRG